MGRERPHRVRHDAGRHPGCGWCPPTAASRFSSPHRSRTRSSTGTRNSSLGARSVLFSVRRKNAWHLGSARPGELASGGCWATAGSSAKARNICRRDISSTRSPAGWSPRHSIRRTAISISRRSHSSNASRPRDSAGPTLRSRPARERSCICRLARRWRTARCCASIVTAVSRRWSRRAPATSIRRFLRTDGSVAVDDRRPSRGSDIWIIDLGRATRIRFTAGGTSAFPVWGPDGSRVAFQSTAPGPWNLFWKPLDGERGARSRCSESAESAGAPPGRTREPIFLPGTLPTLSGAGPQFPMSWSPDGIHAGLSRAKAERRT